MLFLERSVAYERLVTPERDGGILIEPGCETWLEPESAARLEPLALGATTLGAQRGLLRARLGLGDDVVVATGHQAELFHAGVFAKAIAASLFAEQRGGQAVFVTVDSDLPKTTAAAVPVVRGGEVVRERVVLPGAAGEQAQLPAEWQAAVSKDAWRAFFKELGERAPAGGDAALDVFVEAGLRCAGDDATPATLVERGQNAVLEALGCRPLKVVRISELARTGAFRALVAHLVGNAREFALEYNAAQRAFRKRHSVRNPRRPVPLLVVTDRETELPLWVQRRGERRQTLTVARDGARQVLRAGTHELGCVEREMLAESADDARPLWFERDGWEVRPKALLLSGFARLMLSDVFVHGIGGGKYDEMTDDFLARTLGAAPGPLAVVSATLRLDLPQTGVRAEQVRAAQQRHRDLRYNPQRYLRDLPADLLERRAALIRESDRMRKENVRDRAARRRVFDGIHAVNHALLHSDVAQAIRFEEEIRALQHALRSDRIAADREYFFALHALDKLRTLRDTIAEAVG